MSFGQSGSHVALYPFYVFCFGLPDQFATLPGVNIFKCWRTFFVFWKYIISGDMFFGRLWDRSSSVYIYL